MAAKRKRAQAAEPAPSSKSRKSSKATDRLLAKDDARIAELERKLGLKHGRKAAPKSFQDDGLEELFGIDVESNEPERDQHKNEYDEWLAEKRGLVKKRPRREEEREESVDEDDDEASYDEDDLGDSQDGEQVDDGDEFEGFSDASSAQEDEDQASGLDDDEGEDEDEDLPSEPQKRQRENPYVAPMVEGSLAKYIPPSKRLSGPVDNTRLRRQLQGLLNRLTESTIRGIVKDIEKVYAQNARGEVTAVLIDCILAQVSNPATLPDTFFVLTAGFVAALYRIIGESFASHAVTRIVDVYREEYAKARESLNNKVEHHVLEKTTSNLITFLSELYVFQVVGCNLVFDFIRLLLDEMSELNTELLLRVVRMTGKLLRKDDAQALQDIAAKLRSSVQSADKVSERTRFMVDTITDLKNNKLKAGLQESAVVAQHVTTMRKFLGSLSSRGSAVRPLPVGLQDIEQAETKGKWWLVGASFAGNPTEASATATATATDRGTDSGQAPQPDAMEESELEEEDLDLFFPDYAKTAREQGLKTETEQAIFVAIVAANDPSDAHLRLQKLNLSKSHRRDVPFVLLQSVGGEQPYNPYYALVAQKVCQDGRIRFAFQDRLWQIFRRIGEGIFDEDGQDGDDDGDDDVGLDDSRLSNVGRLIGSLVATSTLSVKVLKCLELTSMKRKTSLLVKHMMTAAIRDCAKRGKDNKKGREEALERVFSQAGGSPVLASGLHHVLKKVAKEADKSSWVKKKEVSGIRDGCEYAQQVLTTAVAMRRDE